MWFEKKIHAKNYYHQFCIAGRRRGNNSVQTNLKNSHTFTLITGFFPIYFLKFFFTFFFNLKWYLRSKHCFSFHKNQGQRPGLFLYRPAWLFSFIKFFLFIFHEFKILHPTQTHFCENQGQKSADTIKIRVINSKLNIISKSLLLI